jgi:hypothetical protein
MRNETAMKFPATPEMTSGIINEACWKLHENLPECPAIVFNHLKPAFYEGLKVVLDVMRVQSALTQATASERGEPYTMIDMGFGKWEVGAGTNAGVPCIAFGVHGSGNVGELITIEPRQMSVEETHAVITFANYEGFAVLQEKMDEVRALHFSTAQPTPAARPMDEADMLRCLGAVTYEIPARIPPGWRKVLRAVEAHHGIGSQPTAPAVPEVSRAMLETLRNVANNAVYVANNECALSIAVVKGVEAMVVRAESLLASAPTSPKGGGA